MRLQLRRERLFRAPKPATSVVLAVVMVFASLWSIFIYNSLRSRDMVLDLAGDKLVSMAAGAAYHAGILQTAGIGFSFGEQKFSSQISALETHAEMLPVFLRAMRPAPGTRVALYALSPKQQKEALAYIVLHKSPMSYSIEKSNLVSRVVNPTATLMAVAWQPESAALAIWASYRGFMSVILVLFTCVSSLLTWILVRQLRRREETERDLIAAKNQADAGNRAKSEFLATMSHELRTPLNAIIGFAEVIRDQMFGPVGGKYPEYAGNIHESGSHLLSLINDILDVSKLDAGHLDLVEENIGVAGLLNECIGVMAPQAQKADVSLEVDMPQSIPPFFGDHRRIRQILYNLVSNALKFTPGGGHVVLSVRLRSDGFYISVTDTGIGMSEAEVEKALERFGQIDSIMARKHTGTGLGLPLTKQLVELHDGTLCIASVPSEGTTITLKFPLSRIAYAAQVAAA